jgi:predicted nucleotidyltransferase
VIPFGSYAMGTDMDDSDIDLVCLFTPMFSLEGHFYNCFP